jgi:hypothetical protein
MSGQPHRPASARAPMNGQAFLRETASLIERGWCCGADARNCQGDAVAASHPAATSWSLLGALVAVSERHQTATTALREALWGISGVIPDSSLNAWNNSCGRTQGDTLQMLTLAEANLDEQPPPRATV